MVNNPIRKMSKEKLQVKLEDAIGDKAFIKEQRIKLKEKRDTIKQNINVLEMEKQQIKKDRKNIENQLDSAVMKGKDTTELHQSYRNKKQRLNDIKRQKQLLKERELKIEIALLDNKEKYLKADKEVKQLEVFLENKDLEKLKEKYDEKEKQVNKLRAIYSVADREARTSNIKQEKRKLQDELKSMKGGE